MLSFTNTPFLLSVKNKPFMLIGTNNPFMLCVTNKPFMLNVTNKPSILSDEVPLKVGRIKVELPLSSTKFLFQVLFSLLLITIRLYVMLTKGKCNSSARLDGCTVLVTGANNGNLTTL